MQGVSPEGANAGLPNQIYLIGNPSPRADYFVNEKEEKYNRPVRLRRIASMTMAPRRTAWETI